MAKTRSTPARGSPRTTGLAPVLTAGWRQSITSRHRRPARARAHSTLLCYTARPPGRRCRHGPQGLATANAMPGSDSVSVVRGGTLVHPRDFSAARSIARRIWLETVGAERSRAPALRASRVVHHRTLGPSRAARRLLLALLRDDVATRVRSFCRWMWRIEQLTPVIPGQCRKRPAESNRDADRAGFCPLLSIGDRHGINRSMRVTRIPSAPRALSSATAR